MAGRSDPEATGKPVELIDPMMGSGTFLLEAGGRDHLAEKREFAFENFVVQPSENPTLQVERPQFCRLIGFESEAKTLKAARENLLNLKPETPLELYGQDFFKAAPIPKTEARRWVLANPPYGERLKIKEPLKEYYEDLFAACERAAQPDRAYFLLPAKAVKGKFNLPLQWKVIEKRPFVNGGIPVVAFGFGRK
jgi:23S rRNA G2445 N2-methylase RlmL